MNPIHLLKNGRVPWALRHRAGLAAAAALCLYVQPASAAPPAAATPAPSAPAGAAAASGSQLLFKPSGATSGKQLLPGSAEIAKARAEARTPVGRVTPLDRASFTAIASVRRGDSVSLPLSDSEVAEGRLNLTVTEADGAMRIAGNLATGEKDAFSMWQKDGRVGGTIVVPSRQLAYRIEQDASGAVLLKEVPLSEVICWPLPRPVNEPARSQALGPVAAPPVLNSRPTAVAQLYLDFDGELVTDPNWNGGNTIIADAYDLSASEITTIFNRVKEDFWPFNINVTTDVTRYNNAPVGRRMRCIITPTSSWYGSAGGVAYVNSFNRAGSSFSSTVPCWVFNSSVSAISEAVSHELGHTLGLGHDGRTSPAEEYYEGQGTGATSWAPIMGVGYYVNVVQWSKGEYQNPSNTEDDVAIISNATNGFGYATDEAGGTIGSAAALSVNGSSANQTGLIASASDVDFFSFNTSGGAVTITAAVASPSPNLDVDLQIQNSSGTVLASANPANALPATLSTILSAGTYYLRVRGSGANDPLIDGYSNYGSIGAYTLTGTIPPGTPPNLFPAPGTGWSAPVVVSTVTGTNLDSTALLPTDTLYLDWALLNRNADVTGSFSIQLWLDGTLKNTWTAPGLLQNYFYLLQDYNLGSLSAGTHTLRLVVDSSNTIAESDETDNEYTKTIRVGQPNLTTYQPGGWSDKIVLSNVTGTNTDTSLLNTDTIYVDFAPLNNGNISTGGTWVAELYIDNVLRLSSAWPVLNANTYSPAIDWNIGSLAGGSHTIRVKLDAANAIAESNETDNEYSRTFTVGASNTAPTISDIGNQTINEDGSTGPLGFTVGDAQTAAAALTVTGSSSNTALLPNGNIAFGGSGANRTVTVTTLANQSGTATITATVSDGALTASDTFVLTVNAVNDPPTIGDIANQTINANSSTGALAFAVNDIETAGASLSVSGSSNNTTLVPNANISFGGSGANRTVTVTPAANQSGTATISVTVSDGALTASDTFVLTVNATNTAPTITAQPQSTTISSGQQATLTVTATGTAPLSYQWYQGASPSTTNPISGASSSTYTTPALTATASYWVRVSNSVGNANSNTATISVSGVSGRAIAAGQMTGAPGATVDVPIVLTAQGDENSAGFSVNFNTSQLTYVSTTAGTDAPANFLVNPNQSAAGRIGVALSQAIGVSFSAGQKQLAVMRFTIAAGLANGTVSSLTFVDSPIARAVASVTAANLTTTFSAGSVTVAAGFEADVTPRQNGDQQVTVSDWTQVGRFVAGLDTPAGSEFLRADCAPRSTFGDGQLTVADWSQAGRYAAGLDPLTPAGGPSSPGAPALASAKPGGAPVAGATAVRVVQATAMPGSNVEVFLQLDAEGTENAVGFTLQYDASKLTFTASGKGADATDCTLIVNATQAGRVGVAISKPIDATFSAGTHQLVRVSFAVAAGVLGNTPLTFGDVPVRRAVADVLANPVSATFVDGQLVIDDGITRYALTTQAAPAGSGSVTATPQPVVNGKYDAGTPVTLTAAPATGYHFTSWSGDAAGSVSPVQVTMNADRNVTANFELDTFTLTYAAGANGSLTGATSQVVSYGGSGTAVMASPDPGYVFAAWSDGSTANPRTDANVTASISVTANFVRGMLTLAYSAGPNGSLTGATAQTVAFGGSGTAVTAVPAIGYHFLNWSDGATANPRTDTNVTAPIGVTASFEINSYALTYLAGANGSLTGATSQTVAHGGSGTAVTAVPATGYVFVNWSDGSTANPRTDTNVTAPMSVTANFALAGKTLTLSVTPAGSGTIGASPLPGSDGKYSLGTVVTLTPHASGDFVFDSWSGDVTGKGSPAQVTMDSDKSVTAHFARKVALDRLAGTYNGLIQDEPGRPVTHEGSGFTGIKVARTGRFTAGLTVGGMKHVFAGAFDANGDSAPVDVNAGGFPLYRVTLHLDLSDPDGKITGTIDFFDKDCTLLAKRRAFDKKHNPAPHAGRYTVMTAPSGDSVGIREFPQERGIGTLRVDGAGLAKMTLILPDGAKVVRSAGIAADGTWPCFGVLYRRLGFAGGWVTFTTVPGRSDGEGTLDWQKPFVFADKYFWRGFAGRCELLFSRYHGERGVMVLPFAQQQNNAEFRVTGGDLPRLPMDRLLTLDSAGKVSNGLGDRFKLTITMKEGRFLGSFPDPLSGAPRKFHGVIFQQQRFGVGWYEGDASTGGVLFEAAP